MKALRPRRLPQCDGVKTSADVVWVSGVPVEMHRVSPAFEVDGEVVFFHGWGLGPRSYGSTARSLARLGFAVTVPALPGFGMSAVPGGPVLGADLVTSTAVHIAQALSEFDVASDAVFVGHSMGAGIAAIAGEVAQANDVVMLSPVGGDPSVSGLLRAVVSLGNELPHSSWGRAREALPALLRSPRRTMLTGLAAKRMDLVDAVARLANTSQVSIVTAKDDCVTPGGELLAIGGVRYRSVPGSHGWVLSDSDAAAEEVRLHLGASRPTQ